MMSSRATDIRSIAAAPAGIWRRIVFLLSLFLTAIALSAAPSFTTRLDRNTVPVGETVTLSLVFEGLTPNGAPPLPALPNVTLAGGVSQSTEFTIVNGQQTSRQTYTYTLVARQAGDVVIPPLQVQASGRVLTSQAIALKITAANAAADPASALTNLAFVRLIIPKTDAFIGEPIPVEVQLYWQAAQEVQMPQLQAEGFSVGQMPKPAQTRTQIGNAVYNLAVFKMVATPVRGGNLTLGPVNSSLTVLIPVNNPRRSRDPFDAFFGGGQQYQPRPTTLASGTYPMRITPLPVQGVPEGFNGAIGSYQLSVNAGPTNVAVGDPITVKIQITGRGPIDSILFPTQTDWRDFTSYPATSKSEPADELGLSGSRSFEQVIIPQNHEIKLLPPFKFSFFDPALRNYRTLSGPVVPLTVRPTGIAQTLLSNLTNAPGQPSQSDDIVHIKPRLDTAGASPLLLTTPWFLVLQSLPFGLWLGLFAARKRRESLANNPRLRRRREVAQRVRDGLKELRVHAEARQSDQFFAQLFRVLQEQLGERLDLPATAITEAVIDEHLRRRNLPEPATKALHELFQSCNLARYAPVQSSQELAALIPKLEGVLRDLQQLQP